MLKLDLPDLYSQEIIVISFVMQLTTAYNYYEQVCNIPFLFPGLLRTPMIKCILLVGRYMRAQTCKDCCSSAS